jgi:putative phosphoribosyl transferase
MFTDRTQAGKLLATKLEHGFSTQPSLDRSEVIVAGLPRGGVPVALEVARRFGCKLDLIVAKKLPFPGQPEYAIGAVSSDGVVVLNPDIPSEPDWINYIEAQRQRLLHDTRDIERQFYESGGCVPSSFKGKTVIIVDDGIATGMTAEAAAKTARMRGASYIIVAAPVMSYQSYTELRKSCDATVAVIAPQHFQAVGEHYADFSQTSNEEVVDDLKQSKSFVVVGESMGNQPGVNSLTNHIN